MKITGTDLLIQVLVKNKDLRRIVGVVAKHGGDLQEDAQRFAPVDTGTLKRSISLEIKDDGMTAIISPNVDYDIYQEYGTRFQEGTPFMRPAVKSVGPRFIAELKEKLK